MWVMCSGRPRDNACTPACASDTPARSSDISTARALYVKLADRNSRSREDCELQGKFIARNRSSRRASLMALPKIVYEHEVTAYLVGLRIENCPTIRGNRDVVFGAASYLKGQDLRGFPCGEVIKANTCMLPYGLGDEVNSFFSHCPFTDRIHTVQNLLFFTSLNWYSPHAA
jgi:hypothetical protein